jgi:hypothetical protein
MRDGSGMKSPAPYRLLWTIAVILLCWESESSIAFGPRVFRRCFGCENALSAPWFGWKMFLEQNLSATSAETRAVLFIRALSVPVVLAVGHCLNVGKQVCPTLSIICR